MFVSLEFRLENLSKLHFSALLFSSAIFMWNNEELCMYPVLHGTWKKKNLFILVYTWIECLQVCLDMSPTETLFCMYRKSGYGCSILVPIHQVAFQTRFIKTSIRCLHAHSITRRLLKPDQNQDTGVQTRVNTPIVFSLKSTFLVIKRSLKTWFRVHFWRFVPTVRQARPHAHPHTHKHAPTPNNLALSHSYPPSTFMGLQPLKYILRFSLGGKWNCRVLDKL